VACLLRQAKKMAFMGLSCGNFYQLASAFRLHVSFGGEVGLRGLLAVGERSNGGLGGLGR